MALYIGLDIGRTAVKCVSVRTSYRKVRLESLALVELSEFGGDTTLAVQAAFGRLFGGRSQQHDGIAISLAGESVSQKTLHLPLTAQKQLAEVLPLQLADEVPFEMDDAVFDYRIGRPRGLGEAPVTDIEVHAVVARIDDVRARIDFVKAALSHEPERVAVGAFPLGNLAPSCPALFGAGPEEVVALLDLGMKQSDLLLLSGGEIVFSRTLSMGTEGLPGTAAKLSRELRTSFLAHKSQGGKEPARLVLAGGGAFVSGAEVFLASQLGLATTVLGVPEIEIDAPNPGKKDTGPDPRVTMVQAELQRFARYAKALGLALGHTSRAVDFDLRRGPLAFERGFGWLQSRVPQLVAFGTVLGIALLVSATIRLVALSRERTVLEEALGTVTSEVLGERVIEADRAEELLAGQTESADPDPLPHADSFDVLVMLSKNIPDSVVHDLEEVDVNKGKVLVHGIVSSVSESQDILANLKTERCVFGPKITGTSQMVGATRQKYVLELEIRCPEDAKKDPKKKTPTPAASGEVQK